jgi:DNA polymerase-3 subunit alpha
MSKKKAYVMEQERKNFIYGNEEEGVKGCIKNGISEEIAGKIYDEMIDFAKYAFNKSHAACYAVVSFQTAYLKTYYPVEFMAALMTSVIDRTDKVAEYIYSCRQMGIDILPPNVNKSEMGFSVENGAIRFGLSAIKNLGRPTINAILQDRREHEEFKSMQDFINRMCQELNKRALENFIKAGAFDEFYDNRRSMLTVYDKMLDTANKKNKDAMSGQLSLFDLVSDDAKIGYEIPMPKIKDYNKEELLEFEKEVLGVYVSGHPLDEYSGMWKKHISAMSTDFELDEETGETKVSDMSNQTIGGMIINKTIKSTKNGQLMAFLTIEDLVGDVEVIVFPRNFISNRAVIESANKVFITGKVQANVDEKAKLICDKVISFDSIARKLWVRFESLDMYNANKEALVNTIGNRPGKDSVIIYCTKEKQRLSLDGNPLISIDSGLIADLRKQFGVKNVETT